MTAVLYAKRGSVYNDLAVDVWDEARDARLYPGPFPVIAHPPCRSWGRFAQWAKPADHERDLAFHALSCVRRYGGVLEHPNGSKLWRVAGLPRPGEPPDEYGGYSVTVNQVDWGHRAIKSTLLYIVGVPLHALPERPSPGVPVTTVERMWRGEREATPERFAIWLLQIANRVHSSLVPMCN
ncbi:MAG: hypothetical protein E5Y55_20920 [Mesorhizobium sp.]|uniref:hypothetical protein n=1 Tax=Mesorhizobium sp. TaxID=1871066 RepID=UPI00121C6549|nr:hypothetical protein [Mesorhizobium sp.]TIM42882.1 MAG: hypothetical protein E5Y55_20920 [Mesorhizobium sp.]